MEPSLPTELGFGEVLLQPSPTLNPPTLCGLAAPRSLAIPARAMHRGGKASRQAISARALFVAEGQQSPTVAGEATAAARVAEVVETGALAAMEVIQRGMTAIVR